MRRILDWVTTVPTIVAFGLTLGIFEVVGRIALLFGPRAFEASMGALQWSLLRAFRLSGTRVVIERSSGVRPRTGYVLISNHQSMFDVPIFGGALFTNYPKYVAKKELGRWIPSVSLNLKHGGNALIDRNDRSQATEAIRDMGREAQRRGVSVVIFPEGTRSREGELGEFRLRGSEMLLQAAPDLQIVPTVIDGSWRLFSRNMLPVPFGTTVRVRFGDPIGRTADEDMVDLMRRVEAFIAGTLAEWRGSE